MVHRGADPWGLGRDAARQDVAEIFPEALIPGVAARRGAAVLERQTDGNLAAHQHRPDDSATVGQGAAAAVDPALTARILAARAASPVAEAQFRGAELAGLFALPLKRAQLQLVAAEPARSDVLDALEQGRQA